MKTGNEVLTYGLSLLTACAALFGALAPAFASDKKPNVVFMPADNVGWGNIGVYGGGAVRGMPTPRIDYARPRPGGPQRRGAHRAADQPALWRPLLDTANLSLKVRASLGTDDRDVIVRQRLIEQTTTTDWSRS